MRASKSNLLVSSAVALEMNRMAKGSKGARGANSATGPVHTYHQCPRFLLNSTAGASCDYDEGYLEQHPGLFLGQDTPRHLALQYSFFEKKNSACGSLGCSARYLKTYRGFGQGLRGTTHSPTILRVIFP